MHVGRELSFLIIYNWINQFKIILLCHGFSFMFCCDSRRGEENCVSNFNKTIIRLLISDPESNDAIKSLPIAFIH